MGKIAFVFPGQGAQVPGMGRQLFESSPEARAVFDMAETIRPGTIAQCFEGSEDELKETKNTQPCLYTVELAAAFALKAAGICADMAAGFSLGEITALAYCGMVSPEEGFKLVAERGALMQQAAEAVPAAMAAVLKLSNEKVAELCAQFDQMYPVNYNYTGQVSVSGLEKDMDALKAAARAAGGLAKPIKVKGGFHSPFMQSAAAGFAAVLDGVKIGNPEIPLYSNFTGEPYSQNPKRLLADQIVNPVRWEKIVQNMIAAGATTFIEVGPGHTLAGFIKKISADVNVYTVCKPEDVAAVIENI